MQRLNIGPREGYVCASVVLFAAMLGQTANRLWSNLDFWVWLGPVREFAERPLRPTHPLLAVDAADSYMGPYAWLVGVVVRCTGADPVDAMAVAGLANVVLLVAGIWVLSSTVSRQRWAPLLTLIFTLVAWGLAPWRWSGYLNLNSMGVVLPLGSTFAFGTALFFLAALYAWAERRRPAHLAAATLLFAVTLLSHQVTGMWSALIGAGFLLAKWGTYQRVDIRWLVAFVVAGGALVAMWPFYSLTGLLRGAGGFDEINSASYDNAILRTIFAWPGLVILGDRLRRDIRDPLGLAGMLVLVPFLWGWLAERGSLGRLLPGLLLVAHLAMAVWFAERMSESLAGRRSFVLRAGLAFLVAIGLATTAEGWVRSVPRAWVPDSVARELRLTSYVEPNLEFARYFSSHDVVAAVEGASIPIGGVAAKVISVGIPQPFIEDADERLADVERMLDPMTPSTERALLIDRYDPGWLVVRQEDAEALLDELLEATDVGEVNGFAIIRLGPNG